MRRLLAVLIVLGLAGCSGRTPPSAIGLVSREAFTHDGSPWVAARLFGGGEGAPDLLFVFEDDRAVYLVATHEPPRNFSFTASYDREQLSQLMDAVGWTGPAPRAMMTLRAAEHGWHDALGAAWNFEQLPSGNSCTDFGRSFERPSANGTIESRLWSCGATQPYAVLLDGIVMHAWALAAQSSNP